MSSKDKPSATDAEKPKKKKNYLNKRDMLAELKRCHDANEMTPEFARMITLLADRYGSRFEYADYAPHIDDMKAVAVMNIVRAWRSFDMERFDNPFAYFTQAIKHTFWQYVHQEKKHRLNRDHLLISNGELPSDAFMDDYEKEITDAMLDKLLGNPKIDKMSKPQKEAYEEEKKRRRTEVLPEEQKPGEVVTIDISDYLRELEERGPIEKSSPYGMHGDIDDVESFSDSGNNDNYDNY